MSRPSLASADFRLVSRSPPSRATQILQILELERRRVVRNRSTGLRDCSERARQCVHVKHQAHHKQVGWFFFFFNRISPPPTRNARWYLRDVFVVGFFSSSNAKVYCAHGLLTEILSDFVETFGRVKQPLQYVPKHYRLSCAAYFHSGKPQLPSALLRRQTVLTLESQSIGSHILFSTEDRADLLKSVIYSHSVR